MEGQKRLESRQDNFDQRLDSLEQGQEALKQNQEAFVQGQREIYGLVKGVEETLSYTRAVVERLDINQEKMMGSIKRIEEGQERHERILETLSLRSIEHEIQIRELKKAR